MRMPGVHRLEEVCPLSRESADAAKEKSPPAESKAGISEIGQITGAKSVGLTAASLSAGDEANFRGHLGEAGERVGGLAMVRMVGSLEGALVNRNREGHDFEDAIAEAGYRLGHTENSAVTGCLGAATCLHGLGPLGGNLGHSVDDVCQTAAQLAERALGFTGRCLDISHRNPGNACGKKDQKQLFHESEPNLGEIPGVWQD